MKSIEEIEQEIASKSELRRRMWKTLTPEMQNFVIYMRIVEDIEELEAQKKKELRIKAKISIANRRL